MCKVTCLQLCCKRCYDGVGTESCCLDGTRTESYSLSCSGTDSVFVSGVGVSGWLCDCVVAGVSVFGGGA